MENYSFQYLLEKDKLFRIEDGLNLGEKYVLNPENGCLTKELFKNL